MKGKRYVLAVVIACVCILPTGAFAGWQLYDDFSTGVIDPEKWNIDDSSATISVENGEVKFVHEGGYPSDSSWLFIKNPEQYKAIMATIRIASASGDLRARVGGHVAKDVNGNLIWQATDMRAGDAMISAGLTALEPGTYNFKYDLFWGMFHRPIDVTGWDNQLSIEWNTRNKTFNFKTLSPGEIKFKSYESLSSAGEDMFLGIGTRSNDGSGSGIVYFDDVYVK